MTKTEKALTAVIVCTMIITVGFSIANEITAGESCCSDRAVMAKGIQAAHYELLVNGGGAKAKEILEDVAEVTGIPL